MEGVEPSCHSRPTCGLRCGRAVTSPMGFQGCQSCQHEQVSKKLSVVAIAAGLIVVGCSGSTTSDSPSKEELASEAESDVAQTTETVSVTTTSTTSTTVPPTTTTRPPVTTTTEDPVSRGVVVQTFALSGIASGDPNADEVRQSIINVAESILGSFGRVDVVSAEVSDEVGLQLIVKITTGFSSPSIQKEEAADFLFGFATGLWIPEGFGNILPSGEGGVDLKLTVDGGTSVIPAQTMLDIVARRVSADSVLGF